MSVTRERSLLIALIAQGGPRLIAHPRPSTRAGARSDRGEERLTHVSPFDLSYGAATRMNPCESLHFHERFSRWERAPANSLQHARSHRI